MSEKGQKKTRSERRARCIKNYRSQSKLKAVQRWPQRIAKNRGLTLKYIAERMGKKQPRISEYVGFIIEPPDHVFDQIEQILLEAGV